MNVTIMGKEYSARELSLAQKNKLLAPISGLIKDIAKHAFFKKNNDGGISFGFDDEVGLDQLNIDNILLNALEILPQLLVLAVPDFNDWDNLPESESRSVLDVVYPLQDFGGYISSFFSRLMGTFR